MTLSCMIINGQTDKYVVYILPQHNIFMGWRLGKNLPKKVPWWGSQKGEEGGEALS